MFLFSWEPSISNDYLLALAVLGDGGGGGGGRWFLLVGVGVIQESFSWVKIKQHVDFQPASLLGSTPDTYALFSMSVQCGPPKF